MFLGIEIGGTKLQLGLGAGDGTLAALWRGSVNAAEGADGIRRQIVQAVPELLAKASLERTALQGAGIGFGGPVDDATHTVIKSHQIAGWDNFPLADWVSRHVNLPAVLGNDADVAGLAEALFGAGKGASPVFYITIGSGIGGGLVIDGKIFRGSGRGAAEVGHLRFLMSRDGVEVPRFDILEHVASGWAIERIARQRIVPHLTHNDSPLAQFVGGHPDRLTVRAIGEAARAGDPFAQSLLEVPIHYLAEALCQLIVLLSPRRIVIGGGVSLLGEDLLFAPLRRQVAERAFAPFADSYAIVPAALGEEVVVHGALALARQHIA